MNRFFVMTVLASAVLATGSVEERTEAEGDRGQDC